MLSSGRGMSEVPFIGFKMNSQNGRRNRTLKVYVRRHFLAKGSTKSNESVPSAALPLSQRYCSSRRCARAACSPKLAKQNENRKTTNSFMSINYHRYGSPVQLQLSCPPGSVLWVCASMLGFGSSVTGISVLGIIK